MYKRTYGFGQIVNVAVYIAHTACTIHLLNLPEKDAQRDIIHGLKYLEEMSENWLCAQRTIRILEMSANNWQVDLPSEAAAVFERTLSRWGPWGSWDQASSPSASAESPTMASAHIPKAARSGQSSTGYAVPGNNPPTQQNADQMKVSTPFRSSASPYYYSAPSISSSMSAVPATQQQSAGGQFPQSRFAPPESAYLQPMMNLPYTFQARPGSQQGISQQGIWYDAAQNSEVPGMNTQVTPTTTEASSILGLGDPGSNLVEDSRNWWTMDQNAWAVGVENWGGWSQGDSSTPESTFDLPYQNNASNVIVDRQSPGSGIGASQSAQQPGLVPGILPTSTSDAFLESDVLSYNSVQLNR